jgi:hypothetical protein
VENELIMKYVNDIMIDVCETIRTKMNNTEIVSLSSENEEMRNEKIRENIVLLLSLDMKLPPGLESFCVMQFLRKQGLINSKPYDVFLKTDVDSSVKVD